MTTYNLGVVLTDDDLKTLRQHYYGELANTTDSMLDLWQDIIQQLLGER